MKTFFLLLTLLATASAQKIETLIGDGKPGLSDTQVNNPYGLTIGPDRALYWCDIDGHVIRRMDLKTRKTSIVVGTGVKGNSGDGNLATKAEIDQPYEVRFDTKGNLFFADMTNHVIRRVDKKSGFIRTIAGTGKAGFSGDGGYAVKASLRQPHSIVFDHAGRLLICDIGNDRVRRIDLKSGLIETYLGNGQKKDPVEGAKTFDTPLLAPRAIEVAADGKLYIIKRQGNALYEVDPKHGTYHLLASTGMNGPKGISAGPKQNLFIADTENHAVQRFNLKKGTLTRVAGTGEKGDGPDGDPLQCKMNRPHGVFVDRKGVLYIADSEAHRIRRMQIALR
ncbi:SMP-30/gluconolactonase/LRE family protein [Bryobacter aggregatus]|uniref:SMP-30/gluconolactonase/LRE family protein n=1 Tax=Bryobacter aggregatus TaxID=360054 RepID=UPI00055B8737|nr:SMP-30/gluconolactonase/LRE family protein [Bryobacter aggregatus]